MIDTLGLGIKGGLLLAAGLMAAYLVFTWLRLRQIKKRKGKLAAAPKTSPAIAAVDEDDELDAVVYVRPRPAADPGFAALLGESRERQQPVRTTEVQTLRDEVATLRQTLADLQGELDRMKAAHTVSPLYNEAVGLAQHGIDAEGIAARCGISIAEAELVAALASKQGQGNAEIDDLYGNDYGTEEQHGSTGKRYAFA